MESPNALGKFLQTERGKRKLSLNKLATLSGLSRSTLQWYEKNHTYTPKISPNTIEKLAIALEMVPYEVAQAIGYPVAA